MSKPIGEQFSSNDLRAIVREKKISLRELSCEINYSVTTLSLWLRGIYPNDATLLERAIQRWASAQNLSPRDRRKFAYITDLLDNAEDKQAIIDTILRATQQTKTNRQSSGMPALSFTDGIDRDRNEAVAQSAAAHPPVPFLQKGIRK